MEELPKLYMEELPEDQKRSKLAIGLMILVLLLMPVGVYLTLQIQNPFTQAANQPEPIQNIEPKTTLKLTPRVPTVNNQTIFPVDLELQSEQMPANLVTAKITFSKDLLEVVAIASRSADLTDTTREYVTQEWLDASYNNEEGTVTLTAGIPNPGLKTLPNELSKKLITTIYFRAKNSGEAEIGFQDGSKVIVQDDNGSNLLGQTANANVSITQSGGDFVDRTYEEQAKLINDESTSSANLQILSPIGGEVFSYYKPVVISWMKKEATVAATPTPRSKTATPAPASTVRYRISIIMNGEFLGQLAELSGNLNQYSWNPAKTLTTSYIKPQNKFQIEVIKEENGTEEKVRSKGPFNFVLSDSTSALIFTPETLTPDRTDITADGTTDLIDAAFVLRNFFAPVTEQNHKSDINNDRIINSIDLFLLNLARNKY